MRSAALPRSMFQRVKPQRAGRPAWKCAEAFKRHLRFLPCAKCGQPPRDLSNPIVAAHVDHGGDKGMGTKVSDRHCIPLCDSCHAEQHWVGWATFEKDLPGKLPDAVALACIYWTEWPGRRDWEQANGEGGR